MKKTTVIIGKAARAAARLRGGGSALPGLVVEKIDPSFLLDTLSKLPRGVVVVSGTNGKTTTTKMVVELLESHGLKVFTNKTGSNFTRGVVSAILGEMRGFRFDFDIAVLELDEAHAVQFVRQVKPTYALLLNVLRDQLDRFGEIDRTAKLLTTVAKAAKKHVVLNREDPLIATIACSLPRSKSVSYFGYNPKLAGFFPNDDELHGRATFKKSVLPAAVELTKISDHKATFKIEQKSYSTDMIVSGAHNLFNAAGALAIARAVLGKAADNDVLLSALREMKAAFGRGETIVVNGSKLELILVKNPSGFRSSLASQFNKKAATMIAINDHYADGRDMSWLWDVDFRVITKVAMVSGIRAYDMALRLRYDDVKSDQIEPDLKKALNEFLSVSSDRPKQIFATYTAMLALRKMISKVAKVEEVL